MANPSPTKFTPEQRLKGLRTNRYTAARTRIQKIVDAAPPLTRDQREQLAAILLANDD